MARNPNKKQNKPVAKESYPDVNRGHAVQKWWAPLLVLAITFTAFTSALNNEFVNWDDDRNFYDHPVIKNTTKKTFWEDTKQIFSSGVIGNYNPLSNWTFAVEKVYFGFDKPFNWHLNNVILHLICVLLVYKIALMLRIGWMGSAVVALLFGIHPMRVESVAWITERKDVLFGVFYLGALWQYIKYKHDLKQSRWAWMTLFFILSLLSKIQAVSLPLSMLAIDYYLDHQWSFKRVLNKIPFLVLSLFFGILGVVMLKEFGSLDTVTETTQFSFFERLFIGSYSFVVYLIKFFVPYELSPLYPYPANLSPAFYASMLVLPATLALLYWSYKENKKMIFMGVSFFIVNIIFLLQILGAGQGFLADRFTYIAYLGFFFIVGFYTDKIYVYDFQYKNIVLAGAGFYLAVLSVLTYQQNKIWKNSATLWTHVIQYYGNTTLPYGNRANYYRDNKMYVQAITDYNKTLSLNPKQPQAYNSKARLYFDLAKGRDTLLLALNDYNKAIELKPDDGEFWTNRGATYARLGDLENAISNLTKGIELKPDHATAYMNRSIMYHNVNRPDLALKDIEKYLELEPRHADLWYEKGRTLRALGKEAESISAFTSAIEIGSKNNGLYHYERAKAYMSNQQMENARNDIRMAMDYNYPQIDPQIKSKLGM
jgi:tetratricopeptide (TPR) repeat protein